MAKPMLVGEAYGAEEERHGKPFVGPAGILLNTMLEQAGLSRAAFYITNVFMTRPPNNKVEHFFTNGFGQSDIMPEWNRPGWYMKTEFNGQIARLCHEIDKNQPPIIIALGATALWALTGYKRIGMAAGKFTETGTHLPRGGGIRVLPTWHPAYVLRDNKIMPQVVAHLKLALPYLRPSVQDAAKAPSSPITRRLIRRLP
jgi:DNA polymerase